MILQEPTTLQHKSARIEYTVDGLKRRLRNAEEAETIGWLGFDLAPKGTHRASHTWSEYMGTLFPHSPGRLVQTHLLHEGGGNATEETLGTGGQAGRANGSLVWGSMQRNTAMQRWDWKRGKFSRTVCERNWRTCQWVMLSKLVLIFKTVPAIEKSIFLRSRAVKRLSNRLERIEIGWIKKYSRLQVNRMSKMITDN